MQQSMYLAESSALPGRLSHAHKTVQTGAGSLIKKLLAAWMGLVLVLSCALAAPAVNAETTAEPEAKVGAFYKWYLHALAQNHEPLIDDKQTLAQYVSRSLIKELEKRFHSADGLDADYFIQAQDYLADWEDNVAIGRADIKGKTATMVVTLGATQESKYRLGLTLIQENGLWKIRKIRRA